MKTRTAFLAVNQVKATGYLGLSLLFTISAITLYAQTYVPNGTPLNSPNTVGQYYNSTSISITPPFTASGSNGVFHAYISTDCMPLTNNLSTNYNYLLTTVPRTPYTSASQFANNSTCQLMQTVQYYDGLGKPVQTVQIKGSPLGNDMVSPVVYDMFGRGQVSYLPYTLTGSAVSDGSYKPAALVSGGGQPQFYASPPAGVVTTTAPYSVTGFEMAEEGRVVEQGAPGTAWQIGPGQGDAGSSNHTMRKLYTVNDITSTFSSTYTVGTANPGSHIVALYTAIINSDETRTLARANSNTAVYGAGQLDITISRDENWQPTDGCIGTVEEYKDKEGHIVLKRAYNLNTVSNKVEMLSTYYVYDDYNELAFVLTPQAGPDATNVILQTTLDNLCYQYRYDWKQRLTQKKLPGKGWEFMVYNPIDQVILTQDANQRSVTPQVMSMTKYDGQGRVIISGQYLVSGSSADVTNISIPNQQIRQSLESTYQDTNNPLWESKSSTGIGYTSTAGPAINGNNYYTINYYDDYTAPGLPAAYATGNGATTLQTRGLATASKTMVLNTLGNATPDMLWAVHYYDALGRPALTYQQHYLGGTGSLSTNNYDVVATSYDFSNEVIAATRNHYNKTSTTTPVLIVGNTYTYDHMGRKTQTFELLNGGTNVLLSQLTYNETGQLNKKQLHSENSGSTWLQAITYVYNERGWLAKVNDPTVTPTASTMFAMQLGYNSGSTPQYNGNITSQQWFTYQASGSQTFAYTYDRLNRITAGTSANFSESGIAYDLAGNITTLKRDNNTAYIYNYIDPNSNYNNQLQSVTGLTTGSYAYDYNGNMKTDARIGTGLTYNLLDLPQTVVKSGSINITYVYDASGPKLRKLSGSTITEYIDGIQYDNLTNTSNPVTLDFVQTEEGRATRNTDGSYTYQYDLKDQLGNTRVTFNKNPNSGQAQALQADDYYPFGMRHNISAGTNHYLYNQKELQDETSEYDYGARFYDPMVGRWLVIDPMAEQSRRMSPYNYVFNNPMRLIDPDGMMANLTLDQAEAIESDEANAWGQAKSQEAVNRALGKNSNQGNNFSFDFSHIFGPSKLEAAQLSKAAYNENQWKVGDYIRVDNNYAGVSWDDEKSGFQSALYTKTVDGVTSYVYATAGTQDGKDWANNLTQEVALSEQYEISRNNAVVLNANLGESLSFTGHSLGGGLAALNALTTNSYAMTFNAAALSDATLRSYNVYGRSESKITAFAIIGDPLTTGQLISNFFGRSNQAQGVHKYYKSPSWHWNPIRYHDIDNFIEIFKNQK